MLEVYLVAGRMGSYQECLDRKSSAAIRDARLPPTACCRGCCAVDAARSAFIRAWAATEFHVEGCTSENGAGGFGVAIDATAGLVVDAAGLDDASGLVDPTGLTDAAGFGGAYVGGLGVVTYTTTGAGAGAGTGTGVDWETDGGGFGK